MIALTLGNSLRAVISPQRLHGCIESISGNGSTGIVSLTTEVFSCASYALFDPPAARSGMSSFGKSGQKGGFSGPCSEPTPDT